METATRTSKTYTITMTSELASKAESLATQDGLTVSDLLLEAFRAYFEQRVRKSLTAIGEYAANHNPYGYTEADVPRLIEEVRTEDRARLAEMQTKAG